MTVINFIRHLEPGPVTYTKRVFIVIFHIVWTAVSATIFRILIASHYGYPPTPIFSLSELMMTVAVLHLGRHLQVLHFPRLNGKTLRRIFPIVLIYFFRVASSVDGIDRGGKPLFNVSCRFVLMVTSTMLFERVCLNNQLSVFAHVSVAAMTVGGMIAGVYEEPVWLTNYVLILLNNMFSAAHAVYTKFIIDSREIGLYGLWYYNAIIMLVPTLIIAYATDVLEGWSLNWSPLFFFHVFVMSFLGLVSSYSILLCIYYNGALTTVIIGSLSNALKTWMELLNNAGNSLYNVSTWHYLGLSIIGIACLAYLYDVFEPTPKDEIMSQNVVDPVDNPV